MKKNCGGGEYDPLQVNQLVRNQSQLVDKNYVIHCQILYNHSKFFYLFVVYLL